MSDHAGCMLAIVGSRDCHREARGLVAKVLKAHRPILVISGGAKAKWSDTRAGLLSIDKVAVEEAAAQGIQTYEITPSTYHWAGPGGFMQRNQKIAEACVCLVRIASDTTTTYGSGWTADRAEELGKNVERYVINAKGEVTNG